jgi:hypothetical protein
MVIRLNGWQRLWIVVAVLYLPVVVIVTLSVWPTEADIRLRWNLERQSVEESKSPEIAFGGMMSRAEAERIIAEHVRGDRRIHRDHSPDPANGSRLPGVT